MMAGLGLSEWLIVVFIFMLMFNARRLPEIAKGIGGTLGAFRKGLKGDDERPQKDVKPIEPDEKKKG